jgi:hypothetical protein
MENKKSSTTSKIAVYSIISIFVFGLLITEMIWLFHFASGTFSDKVSLVIAITGVYGLGIGFFSSAPSLQAIRGYAKDMTSVNIVEFVSGNLIFMGFLLHFASLGLKSRSEEGAPIGLRFFGGMLWLASFPFILFYVFFHLLVVVPITYIPNLVASALVTSMAYSAGDVEVQVTQDNKPAGTARFKAAIKENQLAARGFFMGVPSIVLSFLGKWLAVIAAGVTS